MPRQYDRTDVQTHKGNYAPLCYSQRHNIPFRSKHQQYRHKYHVMYKVRERAGEEDAAEMVWQSQTVNVTPQRNLARFRSFANKTAERTRGVRELWEILHVKLFKGPRSFAIFSQLSISQKIPRSKVSDIKVQVGSGGSGRRFSPVDSVPESESEKGEESREKRMQRTRKRDREREGKGERGRDAPTMARRRERKRARGR